MARLAAIVVIGWVSGVAGALLPSAGEDAGLGPTDARVKHAANAVVFAAPRAQDGDATPTPEGDLSVPATGLDTPTPTISTAGPPLPASPAPSPIPYVGELCYGDEQISFIPEDPRTENELIIAVSSRYQNKYPRLAGTERTTFLRERPGQLGYVWEWSIQATWPGQHEYIYYVDSTIPCKKLEMRVRRQYHTPTPTATEVPDAENDNADGDNGETGNENDD
ncbi:MAG: hypothetical protein AB7P40_07155 [Chloroflexota bacterium]